MKSKLYIKFDDILNPIVVKEIRQAVQGKVFINTMLVMLLSEFLIISIMLLASDFETSKSLSVGKSIFFSLLIVLISSTSFIIPLVTAFRFLSEKNEATMDLMFITSLKPSSIILGKYLSAMILVILTYSFCVPFMVISYLFRGIDIPTILFYLLGSFFIITPILFIAILDASTIKGKSAKAETGILIVSIFFVISGSFIPLMEWIAGGSSFVMSKIFLLKLLTIAFYITLFSLILFVLDVAVNSHQFSNRAYPVRITLLVCWITSLVVQLLWVMLTSGRKDISLLFIWGIISIIIFSIGFLFGILELPYLTPRIKREISQSSFLRIPQFFLFSGMFNAIAFNILMIILTFGIIVFSRSLILLFFLPLFKRTSGETLQLFYVTLGLAIYTFDYSMTAFFLKKNFIRKTMKKLNTATLAVILLIVGCFLPFILIILFYGQGITFKFSNIAYFMLTNPYGLFVKKYYFMYLTFASVWAIVLFLLSIPMFKKAIQSFKPAILST